MGAVEKADAAAEVDRRPVVGRIGGVGAGVEPTARKREAEAVGERQRGAGADLRRRRGGAAVDARPLAGVEVADERVADVPAEAGGGDVDRARGRCATGSGSSGAGPALLGSWQPASAAFGWVEGGAAWGRPASLAERMPNTPTGREPRPRLSARTRAAGRDSSRRRSLRSTLPRAASIARRPPLRTRKRPRLSPPAFPASPARLPSVRRSPPGAPAACRWQGRYRPRAAAPSRSIRPDRSAAATRSGARRPLPPRLG